MHPRRLPGSRKQCASHVPQVSLARSGSGVDPRREHSAQNARDVRVDELGPPLPCERRDRTGGVRPNPRQLAKFFRMRRQFPTVRDDLSSKAMEIAHASVITQAFPRLSNVCWTRFRHVVQRRESTEESLIVANDA
jgi:hypothetical protein